ncbi:hypothetical protein H6G36_02200 [Anabaena minutissima FACHB-250]|nr:hypothetical protein [Anabaena minutissima FACHB-250]
MYRLTLLMYRLTLPMYRLTLLMYRLTLLIYRLTLPMCRLTSPMYRLTILCVHSSLQEEESNVTPPSLIGKGVGGLGLLQVKAEGES